MPWKVRTSLVTIMNYKDFSVARDGKLIDPELRSTEAKEGFLNISGLDCFAFADQAPYITNLDLKLSPLQSFEPVTVFK